MFSILFYFSIVRPQTPKTRECSVILNRIVKCSHEKCTRLFGSRTEMLEHAKEFHAFKRPFAPKQTHQRPKKQSIHSSQPQYENPIQTMAFASNTREKEYSYRISHSKSSDLMLYLEAYPSQQINDDNVSTVTKHTSSSNRKSKENQIVEENLGERTQSKSKQSTTKSPLKEVNVAIVAVEKKRRVAGIDYSFVMNDVEKDLILGNTKILLTEKNI